MEKKAEQGPAGTAGQERAAKVEPSGYRGDNPSTAGPGDVGVKSATPENNAGQLDPSAPGNTGTTPGTNAEHSK
jgi:hypothetical protein